MTNITTPQGFKNVLGKKFNRLKEIQKESDVLSQSISEIVEAYLNGKEISETDFEQYYLSENFDFVFKEVDKKKEEKEFKLN
jgi:predicted O-methyltransferase YrrM